MLLFLQWITFDRMVSMSFEYAERIPTVSVLQVAHLEQLTSSQLLHREAQAVDQSFLAFGHLVNLRYFHSLLALLCSNICFQKLFLSRFKLVEAGMEWVKLEWAPSEEGAGYIVEFREVGDPNWYTANQHPITLNCIHGKKLCHSVFPEYPTQRVLFDNRLSISGRQVHPSESKSFMVVFLSVNYGCETIY